MSSTVIKNETKKTNSNKQYLAYYIDREGTVPLPTIEKGQNKGKHAMRLGDIDTGRTVKTTIYVKSLSDYDMALEPVFPKNQNEQDLRISQYPAILQAHSIQPISITFSCDPDRDKPLSALWDFKIALLARE